jgi:hypothetical protein
MRIADHELPRVVKEIALLALRDTVQIAQYTLAHLGGRFVRKCNG